MTAVALNINARGSKTRDLLTNESITARMPVMKKTIAAITLFLVALSAQAGGRGSQGSPGGAEGAQGNGTAQLGYFPGWQTASPVVREKLLAEQPKAPSASAAKAEWPAWVRVDRDSALASE